MNEQCILCGDAALPHSLRGLANVLCIACPSCGDYAFTLFAQEEIKKLPPVSPGRLNLISYTYSQPPVEHEFFPLLWKCRTEPAGFPDAPKIIRDIEDFINAPIQHARKPDELLRLLATKLSTISPFGKVALTIREVRGLKIAGWAELAHWMQVLVDLGFVHEGEVHAWIVQHKTDVDAKSGQMPPVRLTPAGWTHAEELFGNVGSTSCFIAMSFTLSERAAVQNAIEEACRATGWTAKTVDQEEYAGGVMDKILALINQARFVVADYTENKRGVYYEAGYAEGHGLPVISTVQDGHMGEVHFDTRHLNFIVWKTPGELKERLQARIGAVINK